MSLNWHVIYTEPRAEFSVAAALKRLGFESLALYYIKPMMNRYTRRVSTRYCPYFPRYIFVGAAPDQSWHGVKTTQGVSTPLYGADGPYRLPDDAMGDLLTRCDGDGCVGIREASTERVRYRSGTELMLTEGPFRGWHAKVLTDRGNSVDICVDSARGGVKISVAADALVARVM